MHGFTVAGTSADCKIAAVGAACGDGLGTGLKTACVSFWHELTSSKRAIEVAIRVTGPGV